MPLIQDALALYDGDTPAVAVYLGDELVWPSTPPVPDPLLLISITPNTAPVGALPPDVTAIGTGFVPMATVQIVAGSTGGPADLTTRFISDTELSFSLWGNSAVGVSEIRVRNGIIGSEQSNSLPYTWT